MIGVGQTGMDIEWPARNSEIEMRISLSHVNCGHFSFETFPDWAEMLHSEFLGL